MSYRDYFRGKKITLMGLGLLGRGVGDAAFLAKCGAEITVTDAKTARELAPSVRLLKKYPNVRLVLGGHRVRNFNNCDFVLKAAGIPLDSPYVKEAHKSNVPVYMSAALFVKLLPPDVTVIGVTGTRGKTTTAYLICEILKQHTTYNMQHTKPKVFLGGNIQGISTLALLPKVHSRDFVVLELDSWQLQGFGTLRVSPHIAVFTNFLPDHLNYYGTMKRYFSDKANIFKYQKVGDYFITCEKTVENCVQGETLRAKRFHLAPTVFKQFFHKLNVKIPGEHNRANIACAIAAADVLGVPREVTKKAVESFRGVPGRLELVRELRGIKIYNDTTATTPDATVAALRALGTTKQRSNEAKKQKIILIMGGADKRLDMSGLMREIPKYCKSIVLLAGTGTERIMKHGLGIINKKSIIHNSRFIIQNAPVCASLHDAVAQSISLAKNSDIVLFSPAFASFGMFKNEYDRGEKFNRLVRRLN